MDIIILICYITLVLPYLIYIFWYCFTFLKVYNRMKRENENPKFFRKKYLTFLLICLIAMLVFTTLMFAFWDELKFGSAFYILLIPSISILSQFVIVGDYSVFTRAERVLYSDISEIRFDDEKCSYFFILKNNETKLFNTLNKNKELKKFLISKGIPIISKPLKQ